MKQGGVSTTRSDQGFFRGMGYSAERRYSSSLANSNRGSERGAISLPHGFIPEHDDE
jgi:hypothetical protein